jgi:diguanylate cyclase (GGDEF)-like protein
MASFSEQFAARRILVVDDEASSRLLVRDHLAAAGYDVVLAGCGREAITRLAAADIQLLITDWLMPDIDGLELCQCARANEALGNLFIIVLTIQSQPHHIEAAFAAGCDDFITKPFVREELIARVHNGFRFLRMQADLSSRTHEALRYADEVAIANQRLTELATTDTLTGLTNRRAGLRRLEALLQATRRAGQPLSVMIADVDHFKSINDSFGHDVGDQVLRQVAQRLRNTLRARDVVCRWGGEEFLFICPSTAGDELHVLAERCRRAIADSTIAARGCNVPATLSIGLATCAQGTRGGDALIRDADAALYEAKRGGRNRVAGQVAADPAAQI